MEIQWEAPPPQVLERTTNRGAYVEFAVALRERQGEWAVMPPPTKAGAGTRTTSAGSALAQNIRRGKVNGFKAGEYEAVADAGKVWVRYVGPKAVPPGVTPIGDGAAQRELAAKARQWARDQGMNVSERGNLSRNVLAAYCKAKGLAVPE